MRMDLYSRAANTGKNAASNRKDQPEQSALKVARRWSRKKRVIVRKAQKRQSSRRKRALRPNTKAVLRSQRAEKKNQKFCQLKLPAHCRECEFTDDRLVSKSQPLFAEAWSRSRRKSSDQSFDCRRHFQSTKEFSARSGNRLLYHLQMDRQLRHPVFPPPNVQVIKSSPSRRREDPSRIFL